jgi:hypothetical protein
MVSLGIVYLFAVFSSATGNWNSHPNMVVTCWMEDTFLLGSYMPEINGVIVGISFDIVH